MYLIVSNNLTEETIFENIRFKKIVFLKKLDLDYNKYKKKLQYFFFQAFDIFKTSFCAHNKK